VKGSDKAVVMGVIVAVVLAGFYLKVVSPKRQEASSLSKDITQLQAQVDEQHQLAQFAEDARQHFPAYYGRLVVLGKAVPSDADTPSLLVQLNTLAERTGVKFNGLELSAGSGDASTAGPAPSSSSATTPSTSGSSGTSTTSGSPSTTPSASSTTSSSAPTAETTTPTAATEATAANLPLGATVGSAGLPLMPYDLTFEGSYFDVTDFLKGVDDLVHLRGTAQVSADGRLLTVNGFSLSLADSTTPGPNPKLVVTLSVTSYLTPSDQGATAGASPSGPGSSLTQPQTQPASATVAP
jgi:Tfp pilus assembly protein PilO